MMSPTMRVGNSIAFTFLVGILLCTQPVGAGDLSDPYEKSLHPNFPSTLSPQLTMEETDELLIVPVSRLRANLSQTEVEDPLPAEQIAKLVDYVNLVAERRKTHRKVCHTSPADWSRHTLPTDPKAPNAVDLRYSVAVQQIVLLGSIEFIVPSWDFQYETVVSVVSFRIEEVLADSSQSLAAGDLVTYVRQWGETTILGIDFCTNPPSQVSAETAPTLGDSLILTGIDDLRNPDHLVVTHERIFPVIDGFVHPPEGDTTPPGFSDRVATLEEIRELFH